MFAVQEGGLGRPVVVGTDEGRAENAPVKVVQKKVVRQATSDQATAYYENDRLILERFEAKILALPQPLAGFRRNKVVALKRSMRHSGRFAWLFFYTLLLRLYYVAVAEWKTERLRHAQLSWLSSDQIFTLACWYLTTKSLSLSFYDLRLWFPYMLRGKTKAWHAHECTELLVLRHCHRDSTESHWKQALYHYMNARALHARGGFPLKMIRRSIDKALSAADQWVTVNDTADAFFARMKCVCLKIDVGMLYWRLAESEWVNNKELFDLSRSLLLSAKEIASTSPQEIPEALYIDSLLEKLALAEKQVLAR